jgi:ATP-binding cassette subfamily F protein 3
MGGGFAYGSGDDFLAGKGIGDRRIMTLIAGENISKQFDDQIVFQNLSFSVNENDRIGLVGPNGIGKTTLFEMLTGRLTPDNGSVVKARGCLIGYVEQEFPGASDISLFDYVSSARKDLLDLRKEMEAVEKELADHPVSQKEIERLGDLQHRFESEGGYEFENEIKTILQGLGFPENRFHNPVSDFSGGEKNRASLARILAGQSSLLFLDEPTNHLDIDSTVWLEEYLVGLNKAYIIVSHDRTFLNNTVSKVWEISSRKIEQYFNGFEKYLTEREERKNQREHLYKHQQEEIKRIEDFIRRNMAGQKTKQAQSKMKYLARIKRIELPAVEDKGMSISLASGERSYNQVLSVEEAAFGYGNHSLISGVNFTLYRGDRVGLIGHNGSGKTTILKSILGELELPGGTIRLGQKVEPAYFDQELSDLNEENTVLDELWQVDPLTEAGRMRTFLARFGFRGEDVLKKVAVLSGGEKTKLALAKLLFLPANFLIFDEPTNHLDLDSRQALEEALRNYSGTYLLVSHDRHFLDRVVERIIAIEDNTARIYNGNYSYYKEKKDEVRFQPAKKPTDLERIRQYEDFKKLSQSKGRIKKEIQSTISKIKDNENILKRLEQDIEFNIPKSDWEKLTAAYREKTRIEDLLLNLYNKWEGLKELDAQYSELDRQSGQE